MAVSPIDTRYSTEMNRIFDEENKVKKWLLVEVSLAKAHAAVGNIPKDAADNISLSVRNVKIARIKEIENEINHDLMAMVRALTEKCSKPAAKYVHYGATSYDIEDTALALIFRDAIELLEKRLGELESVLKKLAISYKKLACIGRTHGQHAVPTTYGLKFALYKKEIERNIERLNEAKKRILVGKMTGAVGTMATFGPKAFEIEELVMKDLGLKRAGITNQVIQRDRHAEIICILAIIASTLDKIAKEIRNLQRTEILELSEPFGSKQVGSSTMPQKRNPHKSERICSLARIVRNNVHVALENIPLEHERDLTNSANERIIFSESFILSDYMLKELIKILSDLTIFPENIRKNLKLTNGLVMAERVMIALTEKGMPRQDAHEVVRVASHKAFAAKKHLKDILCAEKEILHYLTVDELTRLFNEETYIGKAIELVEKELG